MNQRKNTLQKRLFALGEYYTVKGKVISPIRKNKLLDVYERVNDEYFKIINMERAA